MNMKTCPKCGTQVPDDAAFCNNCGENLKDVSPAEEKAPETTADTKESSETKEATETKKADDTKKAEEVKEATESTPATDAASAVTGSTSGSFNASPADTSASYTAPIGNATLDAAKEKNRNKNIGIIAVLCAAFVVLIILIALLSSALGGGYKGPIKTLINNINRGNTKVESYLSCVLPGFAVDTYSDIYSLMRSVDKDAVEDFDDDLLDLFEDMFDELADEYGDDYKITYEIRDAEHLDSRDIKDIEDEYEDLFDLIDGLIDWEDEDFYEDLADDLEDYYDIELSSSQIKKLQKIVENFMNSLENMKIQDAYEVEVKLTIQGKDGKDNQKITFYVIKVNGKWIIDINSLFSSMGGGSLSSNLYWMLLYM